MPIWSFGCPLWRTLTGILCPSDWVSPEKGKITEERNTDIVTGKKEVHPPPLNMMQVDLPPFFLHTTFSPISVLAYNIPSTYNFHLSSPFFFFLNEQRFYLSSAVLGLRCRTSLSLAVVSGGCPRVVVHASHCSGFSCCRAQALEQLAQ